MFCSEEEPLALLIELTPKLAKKRFRDYIYDAWNRECGYCGNPATSLDHIIPRFRSGSSRRNNLLPCCRQCNQSKASKNMEEWYLTQSCYSEVRLSKIKQWMSAELLDISEFLPKAC
jgi:hypothetical protein